MLAEDDPVKQQMDIVDEQLDTTCRVFLGLTMGCARCHDHKFDPLAIERLLRPGRDLQEHADDALASASTPSGTRPASAMPRAVLRLEDLEQIIDRHDNALVNGNTERGCPTEERSARAKLLEEAKKEYAAIPKAMAVAEGTRGRPRGLPARQSPDARARRAAAVPDDPGGRRPAAAEPERTAAGSSWPAG